MRNPINFQRSLEAFYNKTVGTIMPKSMKQEKSQKPRYKKGRREKGYQDLLIEEGCMDFSQYLGPITQHREMILHINSA